MQHTIQFFRDLQLQHPPKDAPDKHVRQCASAPLTRAMRVSMKAAGMKLLMTATKLGISEGYLSKLVTLKYADGEERFPEWFVPAFCWATGSNLLAQVIQRKQDMADEECERTIERRMAHELRAAA